MLLILPYQVRLLSISGQYGNIRLLIYRNDI